VQSRRVFASREFLEEIIHFIRRNPDTGILHTAFVNRY
jgi:hypothetical protein